jgi:Mor family transcriptional regulator
LEIKHEILKLHDSGMKVRGLANKFQLAHPNVSKILDKAEYLKEAKHARPV